MSVEEKIKNELNSLVEESSKLYQNLQSQDTKNFLLGYQEWYTRALAVVKQLIPERLDEFTRLYYDRDVKYTISRYLRAAYTSNEVKIVIHQAYNRFVQQCLILESANTRIDNMLNNIYGILQAEILDNELDAATELYKASHLRAAGTVAGVVLERHLAKICLSRSLTTRKNNPTISDWNELLKGADIYDIPTWRGIQRLADIRNLCTHPKDREPTQDEVDELIRGVERITKTIM